MTGLRRMREEDRPSVLALTVTDDQAAFVDPAADTLAGSASWQDSCVIEADGTVVGYFQIDVSSGRQTVPGAIEVHEVFIDARHQGRGYGKVFARLLKPFLQQTYPEATLACLTVNCKNRHAYRLYAYGGFVDTGDPYHEGRSGPQHIMRMDLNRGE